MQSFRASLDKRRADVATMFDGVARRYDLLNSILSLGLDARWRERCVVAVAPRQDERVLDLAAGTGVSSVAYARAGAHVFPTDLSMGMLQVGKQNRPGLPFTAGDALALPYADDSFDAVTISYGLRNVEDTRAGLRELLRVTKPGGRIVVNEFSTPLAPAFRWLYQDLALAALPKVAAISSNPAAYGYLAESIRHWPDQEGLAAMMAHAGWHDVEWQNLSGGIVALHRGWKQA